MGIVQKISTFSQQTKKLGIVQKISTFSQCVTVLCVTVLCVVCLNVQFVVFLKQKHIFVWDIERQTFAFPFVCTMGPPLRQKPILRRDRPWDELTEEVSEDIEVEERVSDDRMRREAELARLDAYRRLQINMIRTQAYHTVADLRHQCKGMIRGFV